MVFLQSFKHLQRAYSQVQHSKPVQNEQFVQNGHEGNHILKTGELGKKSKLASRRRQYPVLLKWL